MTTEDFKSLLTMLGAAQFGKYESYYFQGHYFDITWNATKHTLKIAKIAKINNHHQYMFAKTINVLDTPLDYIYATELIRRLIKQDHENLDIQSVIASTPIYPKSQR